MLNGPFFNVSRAGMERNSSPKLINVIGFCFHQVGVKPGGGGFPHCRSPCAFLFKISSLFLELVSGPVENQDTGGLHGTSCWLPFKSKAIVTDVKPGTEKSAGPARQSEWPFIEQSYRSIGMDLPCSAGVFMPDWKCNG